jgi:hypothetical protein
MDTGLKFNLELAKERILKLKGLLLRSMLRHSAEMSKQRAFLTLSAFLSGEKSVDEEILNEQLLQLQTQNLMLAK